MLYILLTNAILLFSRSVISDSLQPHEMQHSRLSCISLSPGVCWNSCPRVSHAIQSYPLSPPSALALNHHQHQDLFQWVNSLHQVVKELELQPQYESFQRKFRVDFLQDWLVWSPCCPRDSQESSPTPQFESISSLVLSLLMSQVLKHYPGFAWLFSRSVVSDSLQPRELQHIRLPVLYCLLGFAQTHVHYARGVIQPSHTLLPHSSLTIRTFVGKVIAVLFNMLSRFVIAFLTRSKWLLISWLHSLSTVTLEPKKIKSVTFYFSASVCHETMGPDAMIVFLNVEF